MGPVTHTHNHGLPQGAISPTLSMGCDTVPGPDQVARTGGEIVAVLRKVSLFVVNDHS